MRLIVCMGVCALLSSLAPLSAQSSAAAPVRRLTEADAIARFLAQDPRVRALTARIEEARAVHAERSLWPNPSVTYARESVSGADDTFWLARQELPISGRRQLLRAAGRLAVDAAQAEARFHTLQLQADLRDAYVALLLAQEREGVLRNGVDALRELVERLRTREEAGEGSTYDRIRGARAMLDLEADLAGATAARVRARGWLAQYLGPEAAPDTLVAADALVLTTTRPPLMAVLAEARANRGDLEFARLSSARFDAERQAASRLRVPTPTFTGGSKRSHGVQGTASGYQFSVDITVPLFSRGQAAAALASAQMAQADAEAESWRGRIDAEVRTAHAALRLQQERAERYRQSAAEIAEPLATIGRVAYQEGELGILELLDAERQALDARLHSLDLAAAARAAAIELDRAVGRELRP